MYVHIYVCMYVHIYVCMYVCTYMYEFISLSFSHFTIGSKQSKAIQVANKLQQTNSFKTRIYITKKINLQNSI